MPPSPRKLEPYSMPCCTSPHGELGPVGAYHLRNFFSISKPGGGGCPILSRLKSVLFGFKAK